MSRRAAAVLALALGLFAAPLGSVARAGVPELAARVEEGFRHDGAVVARGASRFLYEGETLTLTLPTGSLPASSVAGCTTVALLGSRGMSFHARVPEAEDRDPLTEAIDLGADESGQRTGRALSAAGVLTLERCEGAARLTHVIVTSDAGRGAIEMVVARSVAPLTPLATLLPERTGGLVPAALDPGPAATLPPAARRADLSEARVVQDGGAVDPRKTVRADGSGAGVVAVLLAAGCHRLEVFPAEPPTRPSPLGPARNRRNARTRLDLDAELRTFDDVVLGRDRSDAMDARLEACVGEPVDARLIFIGAAEGARVVETHGHWPLPSHTPDLWGPLVRGRLARALRAHRMTALPDDPIALAQGAAGTTRVPIALEPGACYLAVAAITHGTPRGLVLRAVIPSRQAGEARAGDDDAAALAFCARGARGVAIEVDARGAALAWGLAFYRVTGGGWEFAK